MNLLHKICFISGLILSFSIVSCTKDTDYDALTEKDGIDYTIQIGKGLTLPLGSFDRIYLTELIDTAKVMQLQADDSGRFYIYEEGTFAPSTFTVDEVPVTVTPNIEQGKFILALNQPSLPFWTEQLLQQLEVGHIFSEYGNLSVVLEQNNIDFTHGSSFSIYQENVDPALVSLSQVSPASPVVVTVTLNLTNVPALKKDVSLHDFQLFVPKYLVVKEETAPGIVPIHEHQWYNTSDTTMQWTEQFTITSIDFTRDEASPLKVNGTIDCGGQLNVTGKATLSNVTVSGSDLIVRLDEEGNKCIGLIHNLALGVQPIVQVPEFNISKVTGQFKPTISPINTSLDINLGDDVDFLSRHDATIDLQNPTVTVHMHNTSPVRIYTDIVLNADNGKQVQFNHLDIHDSEQTGDVTLLLNADNISTGDIHTFLSPIPRQISVQVLPEADSENVYTYELGKPVEVEGTYQVNIPLAFRQLSFCYEELTDDLLGKDRDDILKRLRSLHNITLSLEVTNALPTNLHLEVLGVPYGMENAEDAQPGLISCQVSSDIKAGSITSPVNSPIKAELAIDDLSRLGKLLIRISGQGSDCDFNANQYIKIDKAHIQLGQGIELNLND